MNKATISIPNRWQKGSLQIKQWIEHYSTEHGVHLEVTLTGQLDSGQIYIADDTLDVSERQVCENAIWLISSHLNHINQRKDDVQKSRNEVTDELRKQLQELRALVNESL